MTGFDERSRSNMDETLTATRKFQKEITSGIASLILLSVLDRAAKPMYGYQISKVLGLKDEEAPLMKQGPFTPYFVLWKNISCWPAGWSPQFRVRRAGITRSPTRVSRL